MKSPLSRLMAVVAAVAVLVVPSAAVAKPSNSVKKHANEARKALKKVKKAAHKGNDKVVAKQLALNVSATNDAVEAAKDVATGGSSSKSVASALQPITRLEDQNVGTYADIVDLIGGGTQEDVAGALEEAMAIRGVLFDKLADLVASGDLTVEQQKAIADLLAGVYHGSDEQIEDVGDAIDEGVPEDVENTLTDVIDMAFDQAKGALEQFESLLDIVPDSVRPIIEMTLGLIGDVLDMVNDLVHGILGSILGDGDGGGLLGGLLGGGGGGGLLGGLFGGGNGFGGFGGLFGK